MYLLRVGCNTVAYSTSHAIHYTYSYLFYDRTGMVKVGNGKLGKINTHYNHISRVPRRLFCFGSLVILDVARCYLWLFTLYINIKISKNSC